jgi:hypothetical protein
MLHSIPPDRLGRKRPSVLNVFSDGGNEPRLGLGRLESGDELF